MQKRSFIDSVINTISPSWGTQRMRERMKQEQLQRSYEAASKGRRRANRKSPGTSATFEVQRALTELRNSSRELVRNNPYAKNAVRKIANNVVGTGIIPTPKLSSRPQEKKLKQLWNDWAESTHCDYDGHFDFYGIQKLVMRTVAEAGECIVRKRIVTDKNLPLPLQLQVLEGDFIDSFKHGQLADGGYMYYGIEFNKDNKIVAYWLYEQHPGGDPSYRFNIKSNRFPADEIIHVFEKERPGQLRGVPMMHASMLRLEDLEEYEDAELVRQKIAACFALFVHDPANGGVPIGNTGTDDDLLERVEPGIIEHLPAGKQITAFNPPVTQGYGEYTKNVLRGIASGIGMDYVTLTGDLTATTFSSGRMGWLEFNRNVQEWQWQMMVPMFCNKSWDWFTQMAAVYGYIRFGLSINASWSTPKREMINPEAETKATIEAIQNGLMPWSVAQLEMGYNPEEQLEQMKKDKDSFAASGLPNYADKSAMEAKPQPSQPANKKPDQIDE